MNQIYVYAFTLPTDVDTNNALQTPWFTNTNENWVGLFNCSVDLESVDRCEIQPIQAGVTVYPTILFLKMQPGGEFLEVDRWEGRRFSPDQLVRRVQELIQADLEVIPGGGGESPADGLPGGSPWGVNLPWWLWGAAAAYFTYQATQSRTSTGQLVNGALAFATGMPAFMTLKNS